MTLIWNKLAELEENLPEVLTNIEYSLSKWMKRC